MIKKELRGLRKELKGLPSPDGESWKSAVGEANRLQEEDAITRKSLKQVSVSDDYQIGFLKKKVKNNRIGKEKEQGYHFPDRKRDKGKRKNIWTDRREKDFIE